MIELYQMLAFRVGAVQRIDNSRLRQAYPRSPDTARAGSAVEPRPLVRILGSGDVVLEQLIRHPLPACWQDQLKAPVLEEQATTSRLVSSGQCTLSFAHSDEYWCDGEPVKAVLYEQVSRIGKAISSPMRLEILELLVQGEKTVERLAEQVGVDVKLASAHLKALREARLVQARRDGKFMHYRLSDRDVADLLVKVREVAKEHLVELRVALDQMTAAPDLMSVETRESLLAKARRGDVTVIDVRPNDEYRTAHLPFARSMPLAELQQRIEELPPGKPVVAYCRGPFCVMSDAAVALLRQRGLTAHKIADGVGEWRSMGLPVEC